MNVSHNLERAARHYPGRAAIIFEGNTTTYRELRSGVASVATGLADMGIRRGDRIALFLPNIPAFAIAYLATQRIGAIAVSVNTMLTTDELRHVLSDSGAVCIFTTGELLSALQPLLGDIVPPERVIICEGDAEGHPRLIELYGREHGMDPPLEMDRDDPAAILYTSGTTGRQKGAVLSHGNVISNAFATSHTLRIDPEDRLLLFLPLFHCFGQNFIMNSALTSGACIVLHRRFVPDQIVASITGDRVTMFFGVPTVYIALLNAGITAEQMAGVRYYFSAAAAMPLDVAERWSARFGRSIHEGYGLTETSPFASYNHEWNYRPGSVGTPIENVEVCTVDPDGRRLPANEWGEIVIRGPNVMLGYWNRPKESALALRDGWFHTGDIGYVDGVGYLFLVDRLKDMINAGGFKIWPREVEEALYSHAAIRECAVVGMPDPIKGESVAAFVVLRDGSIETPENLVRHCRAHLAAYKVPQRFEFVASLPKSQTGKILKRVLRDDVVTTQTQ